MNNKMIDYKSRLCTAIFSDVLDDLGYTKQLLPISIKPNFLEAKVYGRARTMTTRPLETGEDPKKVYDGISFLERMNPGEVLGGNSK